MPKISVAAIVKNEALNMRDFLATIEGVADELVIVDTGSTDDTVEIIKNTSTSYPIRLYEKKFEPFHFGKAINAAMDPCIMDYVLFLEADHRLGEGFKDLKQFLGENKPQTVQFRLVDDLVPHFIEYRTRLFKKGIRYLEGKESAVDPVLAFDGESLFFDAPLYHLQGGKYKERRGKHNKIALMLHVDTVPRTRSSVREIVRGVLAFYYIFKKIYIGKEAWKDGWEGFLYAYIKAKNKFLVHYYVSLKPRVPESK